MSVVKFGTMIVVICDHCGEKIHVNGRRLWLPYSEHEAMEQARSKGWEFIRKTQLMACPTCRKETE